MRSSTALALLALAIRAGTAAQADDLFPAAYRASGPPAAPVIPVAPAGRPGLLNRLRRPAEAQVPPGPPRRPAGDGVAANPASPPGPTAREATVRKVQATPTDLGAAIIPGAAPPEASTIGSSLSLQQALTGALTSNPDLLTLRNGNQAAASAEAVEVARHFPVALNPTVFIDYRPITLIPNGTFGNNGTGGSTTGVTNSNSHGGFYHNGQGYLLVALRQPVEFGHQTTHRYNIAKAAYNVVQWQIVQAELTTLVQTYRFFQTAAYRREKLRVASDLAEFNEKLLSSLGRQLQANQRAGLAADAAFARVESRASQQAARAARQDYISALTDLRNQIGVPEAAAETEPLGEFALPGTIQPVDEQAMIQAALNCRADLKAAQAQTNAAAAATKLAKADRIPSAVIGPQYVQDEAGIQYVGLNFVPVLPLLNNGKPLVRQRQAEEQRAHAALQAAQQRAVAQVRSAVAKWNGATVLLGESANLTRDVGPEVASLERLFEAGQVDLNRVQQARQRLIQLENAELDAVWNATQAQADLMLAVGVPNMIQSMVQAAEADAGMAAPTGPAGGQVATPPTPSLNPSPFAPGTAQPPGAR